MRGEGVCPKLLNRPVQVKYAKNKFAKHRFKALFLGLHCLPFCLWRHKIPGGTIPSHGGFRSCLRDYVLVLLQHWKSLSLTISLDQLHSLSPQRLREYSFSCLGAFWFFAVFSLQITEHQTSPYFWTTRPYLMQICHITGSYKYLLQEGYLTHQGTIYGRRDNKEITDGLNFKTKKK